jgi:preprotein translocase subunit SecE
MCTSTIRRSRGFGNSYGFAMLSRRAVAQLARVAVSKAAGWGFESLLPCTVLEEEKGTHMTEEVTTAEKLGPFARLGLFYRQIVSELRKVVWPTRNQLTTYTAVVLVFVSFVIVVVSIFDLVLTKIVFWVFG